MRVFHLACLASFFQLAFGCASGSPPETGKFDLNAMLAREAGSLETQELRSADGSLIASVPARSVAEVDLVDGVYSIELGIGGDANITCWIYPEGINLAAATADISNALLGEAAPLGKIEAKQIDLISAGAIDRYPYLGVRWLYRVLENEAPLVGQLGILAASKGPAGVTCVQNELGFNETFMRVFSELVSTLAVDEGSVPYYVDISTIGLRGMVVGVQVMEFTLDEAGDTRILTSASMALPASPVDLATSDHYDIQFSTPDGQLINQWSQSVESGQVSMSLSLEKNAEGGWTVEGVFQQKEISGEVEAGELVSALGQARALQTLIATGAIGERRVFPSWIPSADPLGTIDAGAELLERLSDGSNRVEFDVGPVTLNGLVDANGSILSADMSVGPLSFQVERVYSYGDL